MVFNNSSLLHNTKVTVDQAFDQAGKWLGAIKSKIFCWLLNLNLTPDKMIEIAYYVGIGFVTGFLLKKYFQVFLLFVLLSAGVIWGLVEFDIITINWHAAQDLAHVSASDTVGVIASGYASWIRQNLLMVVSGLIGFVIGYKVG